jgi:hypothetical protein
MRKLLVVAAVVLPLVTLAQSREPARGSRPRRSRRWSTKKTVINFEDDTIEGDLKRPDGEYVEARRRVDHSNLIKIRENWRDKVMQASGDL